MRFSISMLLSTESHGVSVVMPAGDVCDNE
jgi:hypothetical protein